MLCALFVVVLANRSSGTCVLDLNVLHRRLCDGTCDSWVCGNMQEDIPDVQGWMR